MRKIITLLVLVLAAAMCAQAETAAELMKRAADRLAAAPSLTVKFTATAGDGSTASGTITMARQKFTLDMPGQRVWYDGRLMYSYNVAAGETSLTEPTPDELMEINPFDILHQWQRSYDARLLTAPAGQQRVQLTSKRKGSAVKRAVVTLSSATGLPAAIEAEMSNSATLKVKVTSAAVGKALPASAFTYPAAKYPGVEVVDLR